MFVGIVGSRRRDTPEDLKIVRNALLLILSETEEKVILVSGACPKGADRFAEILARELGLPIILHKPKFNEMKSNTTWEYARVCYDRNTLIAKDSDILIACVAADRKGGTEDTIKKFKNFKKHFAHLGMKLPRLVIV